MLTLNIVQIFARFPHTCGGVPEVEQVTVARGWFSPHMWGCTSFTRPSGSPVIVFPTHVGVYRKKAGVVCTDSRFPHTCGGVPCLPGARTRRIRFPHTCGGVPLWVIDGDKEPKFSPHMWGCTVTLKPSPRHGGVFPTHVGVYRAIKWRHTGVVSFPHTCGGVPKYTAPFALIRAFSPHMWGRTEPTGRQNLRLLVFPTHVGVYRRCSVIKTWVPCFPHTCGGVPLLLETCEY